MSNSAAKIGLFGMALGFALSASIPQARAEWIAPASWTTAAVGTPEYWCKWVFEVNQRNKSMVGNQYVTNAPPDTMRGAMIEAVVKREDYISASPTEIRDDVKAQLEYFDQTVKWGNANNWDVHAPGIPIPTPAFLAASKRLYDYQVKHCGLNVAPLVLK